MYVFLLVFLLRVCDSLMSSLRKDAFGFGVYGILLPIKPLVNALKGRAVKLVALIERCIKSALAKDVSVLFGDGALL